jgi:hypothetical protein
MLDLNAEMGNLLQENGQKQPAMHLSRVDDWTPREVTSLSATGGNEGK